VIVTGMCQPVIRNLNCSRNTAVHRKPRTRVNDRHLWEPVRTRTFVAIPIVNLGRNDIHRMQITAVARCTKPLSSTRRGSQSARPDSRTNPYGQIADPLLNHLGPYAIVLIDQAYDADRIRELIQNRAPRPRPSWRRSRGPVAGRADRFARLQCAGLCDSARGERYRPVYAQFPLSH
jgi:hypothetical protein